MAVPALLRILTMVIGLGIPSANAQESDSQPDLPEDTGLVQSEGTEADSNSEAVDDDAELQETTDDTAGKVPVGEGESPEAADPATEEAEYGNWTVTCVDMGDGSKTCGMHQALFSDQDTNVARIEVFPVSDEPPFAAGATIFTPLGTYLPPAVTLKVDRLDAKNYPFIYCFEEGCVSRFGLTPDEIRDMKIGINMVMTIFNIASPVDEAINLNVSLNGFTKAFDAIKNGSVATP